MNDGIIIEVEDKKMENEDQLVIIEVNPDEKVKTGANSFIVFRTELNRSEQYKNYTQQELSEIAGKKWDELKDSEKNFYAKLSQEKRKKKENKKKKPKRRGQQKKFRPYEKKDRNPQNDSPDNDSPDNETKYNEGFCVCPACLSLYYQWYEYYYLPVGENVVEVTNEMYQPLDYYDNYLEFYLTDVYNYQLY